MNKPIFIIGCPRSGTTMFLDILSVHENCAWTSNFVNRMPNATFLSFFNRLYDIPQLGLYLYANKKKCKFLPKSVEPFAFFNKHLKYFEWEKGGNIPPRRHGEDDMILQEEKKIITLITSICACQNKTRFITKYTDFPRIKYFLKAFPDAIFIHMIRDGRAAAFSYFNEMEYGQFKTWEEREWWSKGWPDEWQKQFLNYQNKLALAAFQWKFFLDNIWEEKKILPPHQYVELKYSDFIENPLAKIKDILDFCDLKKSDKITTFLNKYLHPQKMDYKWKEKLNEKEKNMLAEIIAEDRFKKFLDTY